MAASGSRKRSAATIRDVAREAGISPAAAARALHNYGYASPELRTAAEAAASKLGYAPNRNAQSIKTGRTNIIGVIGADISNPFFSGAMRGIADELGPLGYQTLLINTDESVIKEVAAVQSLVGERVDGIIVSPADVNAIDHLKRLQKKGIPLVLLDRDPVELDADRVVVDNVAAAQSAVESLLRSGHRVGIVAELVGHLEQSVPEKREQDPLDPRILTSSGARLYGWMRAHWSLDVPIDRGLIGRTGGYSSDSAKATALQLLDREADRRPTALFTADNVMSLGAYDAIRELGLRVGEDISFVAFDDVEWMRLVTPAISAIQQPVIQMGKLAGRLLQERMIDHDRPAHTEIISTTFIERESVAALT